MLPLTLHTLKRLRWHIVGWGLGMAYLGMSMVVFIDSLSSQMVLMEKLLETFPKDMMAFFGDMESFTTPTGFLSVELYSMLPLTLGIFAVIVGAGLVVADEENGMMDILLGCPISRTKLFFSRALGVFIATSLVFVITIIATIVPMTWINIGIPVGKVILAFVPAWVQVLFYISLALLMSMLLPSQKIAASVSGVYLVFGYMVDGLANLTHNLDTVAKLSSMYFYQGGDVLSEGLRWDWLLGVFTFALVFTLLAWRKFLTRDLRVRGEGSWHIPKRNQKKSVSI